MGNFREWTICHLSLFMTFVISGLAINGLQLAFYLLIGWWNRPLFKKINYYFLWMIYAQVSINFIAFVICIVRRRRTSSIEKKFVWWVKALQYLLNSLNDFRVNLDREGYKWWWPCMISCGLAWSCIAMCGLVLCNIGAS